MKRDGWTFLTNHGHVLVCLARNPDVLLRDVATSIGITERSVQQIVADLERAGVIIRLRVGRRNRYVVRREEAFRHPLEAGVSVGQFLDLVEDGRRVPRRLAGPHEHAVSAVGHPSVMPLRPGERNGDWASDAHAASDGRWAGDGHWDGRPRRR